MATRKSPKKSAQSKQVKNDKLVDKSTDNVSGKPYNIVLTFGEVQQKFGIYEINDAIADYKALDLHVKLQFGLDIILAEVHGNLQDNANGVSIHIPNLQKNIFNLLLEDSIKSDVYPNFVQACVLRDQAFPTAEIIHSHKGNLSSEIHGKDGWSKPTTRTEITVEDVITLMKEFSSLFPKEKIKEQIKFWKTNLTYTKQKVKSSLKGLLIESIEAELQLLEEFRADSKDTYDNDGLETQITKAIPSHEPTKLIFARKHLNEVIRFPLGGIDEITFERQMPTNEGTVRCEVKGTLRKPNEPEQKVTLSLYNFFRYCIAAKIFPIISGDLLMLLWEEYAPEEVIQTVVNGIITQITGLFPDGISGFLLNGPSPGFPHFGGKRKYILRFSKYLNSPQLKVTYFRFCYAALPNLQEEILSAFDEVELSVHARDADPTIENTATFWLDTFRRNDLIGQEQLKQMITKFVNEFDIYPAHFFDQSVIESMSKYLFQDRRKKYLDYVQRKGEEFLAINPEKERVEGIGDFKMGGISLRQIERQYEREREDAQTVIDWCKVEIQHIDQNENKEIQPLISSSAATVWDIIQYYFKKWYEHPLGQFIIDQIQFENLVQNIKKALDKKDTHIERIVEIEILIEECESLPVGDQRNALLSLMRNRKRYYEKLQKASEVKPDFMTGNSSQNGKQLFNHIAMLNDLAEPILREELIKDKFLTAGIDRDKDGRLLFHSTQQDLAFFVQSMVDNHIFSDTGADSTYADEFSYIDKGTKKFKRIIPNSFKAAREQAKNSDKRSAMILKTVNKILSRLPRE